MHKSVSPIVSIILLIAMTIGASVSAYFFITSTITEVQGGVNTNTPLSDDSRLKIVSISGSKAIIMNEGTGPLTNLVMFVNGELLNYSLAEPLLPGQAIEINYNARMTGEDLEIKILYGSGREAESYSPAVINTPESGFTPTPIGLNEIPPVPLVWPNEWVMEMSYSNRTGWDGISYPVISGLNRNYYSAGQGFSESCPAVVNGFVYVGNYDNKVYQFNASNVRQVIATYTTGDDIDSSPAIANGYVYIGSIDNKIYQLNASNISQLIASYTTGAEIFSSPVVANGFVYVGSDDNKVYQFNASNVSQLIASYITGDSIWTSAVSSKDYIYIGSWDGNFYQLNASNVSQLIANYSTSAGIDAAPILSGEYVYFGSGDNNFYQLNASNISQQISNFSSGISGLYYSPALKGNYFYLPVYDVLFQLNASNISQVINNLTVTPYEFFSSPGVSEDYVYIGSWNNKVYQLNASNISQIISTYLAGGRFYSCPAIANGYIYILNNDKKIYQLNASNIALNNVPPPAPQLPEPLTCGITFTDTTPPVIEVVQSIPYCNPCTTTPYRGVYLKVNVTDDSPIKEVFLTVNKDLSSFENVSMPRLGNSINYEYVGEPRSIGYTFQRVYAVDWNGNTQVIFPSTPSTSGGCSAPSCPSTNKALTAYSVTPNITCLGDSIMVNATASFYGDIKNILLILENPDSNFPYVNESLYLEKLPDNTFGVIYTPNYRGFYNLTLRPKGTDFSVLYYYLGNVSLYE